MDNKVIENDLLARIDQSREWIASNPDAMPLKFRDREWKLKPTQFLDDPKRVERFGVALYLAPADRSKNWKVRVNTRIQPNFNPHFENNKFPYIVTYVVDQLTGADDEISHIDVATSLQYARLIDLPVDEWYLYFVKLAVSNKKTRRKLFEERMQIRD